MIFASQSHTLPRTRRPLIPPPGHRTVSTINGDALALGVTVTAYRGKEWQGEVTIQSIEDDGRLQEVLDMLTKRGPHLHSRQSTVTIRILYDDQVETLFGKGGTFPVFICDACGGRIQKGSMGVYLIAREAYQQGKLTDTAFAHKGECHNRLAAEQGQAGWDEQRKFIAFLAINAGPGEIIADE